MPFIRQAWFNKPCVELARKGVCDGHNAGDDRHDNTADVRVLRLAVDKVTDNRCQRQNQHDWEQPDAHNSRYGIEHHLTRDEECDVLRHYHKLRTNEYEERLPYHADP